MKQLTLKDSQTLVSAKQILWPGHGGRPIPVYDDGFGPIWVHRLSIGISGIVRAQTREDAYEICEDEFFPSCDLTHDEIVAEYGFRREYVSIVKPPGMPERPARRTDYSLSGLLPDEFQFLRWQTIDTPDPVAWPENELFCEAYGFRPNGQGGPTPEKDRGIYAKDLYGDLLDPLTPELCRELGVKLTVLNEE